MLFDVRVIHEVKCLKCIAPFVCILSVVLFHMCHQATWTRWFMITLIAFLWLIFTMCFHTYVSSEHLAVTTQIYIGCIYLVYLHCVSSSVSLNGQLEEMHSCTCCNWMVFRHYAFSNVGTTHFYNCMHSHTDHIFMAFPLCFIKCILKWSAWEAA